MKKKRERTISEVARMGANKVNAARSAKQRKALARKAVLARWAKARAAQKEL